MQPPAAGGGYCAVTVCVSLCRVGCSWCCAVLWGPQQACRAPLTCCLACPAAQTQPKTLTRAHAAAAAPLFVTRAPNRDPVFRLSRHPSRHGSSLGAERDALTEQVRGWGSVPPMVQGSGFRGQLAPHYPQESVCARCPAHGMDVPCPAAITSLALSASRACAGWF